MPRLLEAETSTFSLSLLDCSFHKGILYVADKLGFICTTKIDCRGYNDNDISDEQVIFA